MKREIRNLKFLFLAVCLVLPTVRALAEVRVSLQEDLISVLGRTVLNVECINVAGQSVELPEIDGLRFQYQGPRTSVSMSPGKSSRTTTYSYLVTPSKEGNFVIDPIVVNYNGTEEEFSVSLKVVKPKDDKKAQQISDQLFSRISTDRTAPHVHEPFELELRVYLQDGVQIDGSFRILEGLPQNGMDGTLSWEVIGQTREVIEGNIFKVWTLRTTAKTLTAGTFTFQPKVQMRVVVPRQDRRSYGRNDPFFGDLFGRQEVRPILLDCNKLEVKVRPIPIEGRPDGFTGGVGIFDFDVEVGPTELKAGEPITVKMRIKGNGNISKITPPLLQESHEFKLYDARSVKTSNPREVRFEQVIIPKSGSVSNIPEIVFTYFNTKTSDFRAIKQGPFPVAVEDAPQQVAQVIATVPSSIQLETKVLGRDIVYLKPAPQTWSSGDGPAWQETTPFRIMLISPALVLVLTGFIMRRRARLENDVAFARRQKAPKAARAQLQQADRAARANDEPAFYQAAWNALVEYFGNRMNLAPGEVTKERVLDRAPAHQEEIERLFDLIEQRRYGLRDDSASKKDMKELARELTALLKKSERMKL